MKLRDAVIGLWESGQWAHWLQFPGFKGPARMASDLGTLIRYGFQCGRMCGNRKMKKMNVQELSDKWVSVLVGMCTAHTKDDFDAHDAKADELMGPILTAPIAQVREFYNLLRQKMKDNPGIPMIVWIGFDAWGESTVKHAQDDKSVKRLKTRLAREIADLVEMQVQDQIPEAIARALRWRDPKTLKEVKQKLKAGAKPKIVGRQSCLFLEIGEGPGKTQVML